MVVVCSGVGIPGSISPSLNSLPTFKMYRNIAAQPTFHLSHAFFRKKNMRAVYDVGTCRASNASCVGLHCL